MDTTWCPTRCPTCFQRALKTFESTSHLFDVARTRFDVWIGSKFIEGYLELCWLSLPRCVGVFLLPRCLRLSLQGSAQSPFSLSLHCCSPLPFDTAPMSSHVLFSAEAFALRKCVSIVRNASAYKVREQKMRCHCVIGIVAV